MNISYKLDKQKLFIDNLKKIEVSKPGFVILIILLLRIQANRDFLIILNEKELIVQFKKMELIMFRLFS